MSDRQARKYGDMKYDGIADALGLPPELATDTDNSSDGSVPSTGPAKRTQTSYETSAIEHQLTRAAYLYDKGTQPAMADASFRDWRGMAVEKHAQLQPKRREQLAAGASRIVNDLEQPYLDDPARSKKSIRSLHLDDAPAIALERALQADAKAGITSGASRFVREALRVAVANVNDKAGGLKPVEGALRGGGPRKRTVNAK